jgi:YesN/AraC family two-component response regulator
MRKFIHDELCETYSIETCRDGKEALNKLLTEHYDLVISDVMMPVMDGIELCKKIKQNININYIPVILLTAKTGIEDKMAGLETGADAYIPKPFSTDYLQKSIENLLENRKRISSRFENREKIDEKISEIQIKSNDDTLMEKIIKVINENISNPELNVEMLAQEVGLSRVHLYRKLKELTNLSARDFIRSIRLKQAAKLLISKKINISEVAYTTGFSNLSHFSDSFKDFFGESPKEYIEHHVENHP